VKISFRGRNGYNVGALAAEFGGGGHYAASGCTVSGSLADVLPKALAAAERVIAETEAKLHG
jgi:phosphoesterase RecJ-like protein